MSRFVVGLTGGVASGKSTVAAEFARLGVTIADADHAARAVVARGSEGLAEVVAAFGPGVLTATGDLDRRAMRARVFADAEARKCLEAIIHPRVRRRLMADCAAAEGDYAIAVIPLLAEGGGRAAYPWLSRILVVDVPEAVQQARLVQRDGIGSALARQMLDAQATRDARLAIADDVIANHGPREALTAAVAVLDARYRALAAAPAFTSGR